LVELSSTDVVRACEQNYLDYWRTVGLSSNAEFSEEGGITRCTTGLPQEIFNVVLSCKLQPRVLDERVDAMIESFRSRRLNLIWHVGVLTEPSDLGRHLEARGYPRDYDLTAMAFELRSLEEPPHCSERVIVKTVSTGEESKSWIDCLTRSWESPAEVAPWMLRNACLNKSVEREGRLSLPRKMYLGIIEGEPAGASMLYWSDEIAGLQDVGTVHSKRRCGVGEAVVKAALNDARSMGFGFVVVLSTVEGVRMYEKVGFRTFGKLPEHSMDFR